MSNLCDSHSSFFLLKIVQINRIHLIQLNVYSIQSSVQGYEREIFLTKLCVIQKSQENYCCIHLFCLFQVSEYFLEICVVYTCEIHNAKCSISDSDQCGNGQDEYYYEYKEDEMLS